MLTVVRRCLDIVICMRIVVFFNLFFAAEKRIRGLCPDRWIGDWEKREVLHWSKPARAVVPSPVQDYLTVCLFLFKLVNNHREISTSVRKLCAR